MQFFGFSFALRKCVIQNGKLSEYNFVICVLTNECARWIIKRMAASVRTVAIEVCSRRGVPAHFGIVELSTAAGMIRVVSQTGAFAGYHVVANPDFQTIRTFWVDISVASSCRAQVSTGCPSPVWFDLHGTVYST
jgi:hypothetical protein